MKTIFTTTLSLLCLSLMAQPTITSDWLPKVGDIIWTLSIDSDTLVEAGPSGSNVVWDFSRFPSGDSAQTVKIEIVDASTTPYAADFPNSEVAAFAESFLLYGYFSTDGNCLSEEGNNFAGVVQVNYTKPQKILSVPFTYLDATTEEFEGSTVQSLLTTLHAGNITIEADGYGSIILPGSSAPIDNVLRIKTIETGADSSNLGSGIREKILYESITYTWINNDYPIALATTSVETSTQIGFADGIPNDTLIQSPVYDFTYDPSAVIAKNKIVKANEIGFAISPNPVSKQMNITTDLKTSQLVNLEVYNLQGMKMQEQKERAAQGQSTLSLNTGKLSSGMYVIRLVGENFESSLKFIKE